MTLIGFCDRPDWWKRFTVLLNICREVYTHCVYVTGIPKSHYIRWYVLQMQWVPPISYIVHDTTTIAGYIASCNRRWTKICSCFYSIEVEHVEHAVVYRVHLMFLFPYRPCPYRKNHSSSPVNARNVVGTKRHVRWYSLRQHNTLLLGMFLTMLETRKETATC